tara:strand:- start:2480 stop:3472 length:993 start_codon:yes stop_codon:yes gene_type:complete
MYPIETRNNYLILTPDGVGSTYLQRALTVYLQCAADLDYWNTHELLNGLGNQDGNLYKDWDHQYNQSVEQICNLIMVTGNLLVSRIARYHVTNRILELNEDYSIFYETCNRKFNNILFCKRDPFEYALSWSIRNKSGKLNVYSVSERIDTHGVGVNEPINLDYFQVKLAEYAEYEYWAEDNFNITRTVNYDDLHNNVDSVLTDITGLTHSVKDKFRISLQDYSQFRYLSSMYKQTKDPMYDFDCASVLDDMCNLHAKIERLHNGMNGMRLPTTMPLKMNTLADKRSRITNFNQAVDTYNTWASNGNRHAIVTEEIISNKIDTERLIYVNK